MVLDALPGTGYRLERNGDVVTIRLAGSAVLGAPPPPPRNVRAIAHDSGGLAITLTTGSTVRDLRLGARIVLDIVDPLVILPTPTPPAEKTAAKTEKPAPKPEKPTVVARAPAAPPNPSPPTPAPVAAPPPTPIVVAAALPTPPSTATPKEAAAPPPEQGAQTPTTKPGEPVALIARRTTPPPGVDGVAFTVPFAATVGAAMFVRGDRAFVVFDERRPIDMAALRADTPFSSATVRLSQAATLIQFTLPADKNAALVQTPLGWTVAAVSVAPPIQPIYPSLTDGRMNFPADKPSEVVSIADPETNATLLVGTQRRPGQAIPAARRTVEFILPRTLQGVVVEPLADSIALRVTPGGFALTGPASGLNIVPPSARGDAMAAAAKLSRRFEFSTAPAEDLLRQLSRQISAAANAPARARGPLRQAAAQTMLSLGMSAEAQALLRVTAGQDPKEAASAETIGSLAIASLLAGRPDDAAGIADPALNGTDDVLFWRGIRTAMQKDGTPEAVTAFAATGPLALTFPPPIRDRVLALVVETLIEGGDLASATRLLNQRKDDPQLAYARALRAQAEGDVETALKLLDEVAAGRDQLARAKAAWRAVELRLSSHKIDNAQAADALDKLMYVWRGDRRDLALRERLAELRQMSGAWKPALSILRQAEADFPDRAQRLKGRMRSVFATMLDGDAAEKIPPLEFIAMAEQNADLMPDGSNNEALDERLADRLLALELPKRAEVLLDRLMLGAQAGEKRAGYGARLASLRLREGDPAGALTALVASSAGAVPQDLARQRVVIAASAHARQGNVAGAVALLEPIKSAATDEARASILEQANDWAGATRALSDLVEHIVPETGALAEQHKRALLRLATAAARANDSETLARLRAGQTPRMGDGPMADMFRLLTAEPVRGAEDLPRAAQEAGLARTAAPAVAGAPTATR